MTRLMERNSLRIRESAVLAALLLVVGLVIKLTEDSPNSRFAAYGPNLAVDLFSVFVGIFVVTRIVKWRRERELADTRRAAVHRLRRAVAQFLLDLQGMYVAASLEPTDLPDSIPSLVDAWAAEIGHLDFSKKGHSGRPLYFLVTNAAIDLDAEATAVSARYSEALGDQTVLRIEGLLATRCFAVLRQAQPTVGGTLTTLAEMRERLHEADEAAGKPFRAVTWPETTFCIFGNLEDRDVICQEFATKLKAVVKECEIEGQPLALGSWTGVQRWGSARVALP